MPNFSFQCLEKGCHFKWMREYSGEEFERRMNDGQKTGFHCPKCGSFEPQWIRSKRANRDGFEPGWQDSINEWHTCQAGYRRRLKELGLKEIGNDKSLRPKELSEIETKGRLGSREMAKEFYDIEAKTTPTERMPERQIEELFEDGKIFDKKTKKFGLDEKDNVIQVRAEG